MNATGFQICFLYFAAIFGAMLVSSYTITAFALPQAYLEPIGQATTFAIAALVLVLVPNLRARAIALLAPPVPSAHRVELVLATALKVAIPFGLVGAVALPAILTNDAGALARIPVQSDPERQLAITLQPAMLAITVGLGWFLGPLLEEIYFRGFLYRAWERQWGWVPATLLTSLAFGIGHPTHIASSFLGSIVFICVLRRTGSLRASIYIHSAFNILVFWPFLGHLLFIPRPGEPLAWSTWWMEIAGLVVMAIGIPLYFFLARKPLAPPTAAS